MNAKAISFTPEVLKAKLRALEEHGTCQTRRPMKPQPVEIETAGGGRIWHLETTNGFINSNPDGTWPLGLTHGLRDQDGRVYPAVSPIVSGQRLWVRERARVVDWRGFRQCRIRYEVDGVESDWLPYPARLKGDEATLRGRCIPNGVFREGARHFLEVVEVRAERVSEISGDGAVLEGINPSTVPGVGSDESLRQAYFAIYDSIYGAGAHARDWCWVYTLKRADP